MNDHKFAALKFYIPSGRETRLGSNVEFESDLKLQLILNMIEQSISMAKILELLRVPLDAEHSRTDIPELHLLWHAFKK